MGNRNQFRKGAHPGIQTTRAQQEYCYLVAKRLLRHYELEPELLDVFTKKQKERLFSVCFESPIVKPEKPKTVPRQYIKKIHTDMYQYMKNNFWGDPENQLSYLDLAVYGMSFLVNFSNTFDKEGISIAETPQEEAIKQISEKCKKNVVYNDGFQDVLEHIWHRVRAYSRVNFRIYGYKYDTTERILPCRCCSYVKLVIFLTAQESQSKNFIFNNIERKAFKMFIPESGLFAPTEVTVDRKEIFPKAKTDDKLNIYIQSHVLHRFKERVDILDPENQNLLLQYVFYVNQKLITHENKVLFACLIEEGQYPVGYFTYFVQDNDIVINTFLPLTSSDTPEGKKLQESLPLSKEDMIYLGMDKLSFLLEVDFEQIPTLKQALIDSGIWEIKLALNNMRNEENFEESEYEIDAQKTKMVKSFFDKLDEHHTLVWQTVPTVEI